MARAGYGWVALLLWAAVANADSGVFKAGDLLANGFDPWLDETTGARARYDMQMRKGGVVSTPERVWVYVDKVPAGVYKNAIAVALQTGWELHPQHLYTFSFWARSDAPGRMSAEWVDSSDEMNRYTGTEVDTILEWQRFSFDFRTPIKQRTYRLIFGLAFKETTYSIDEIEVFDHGLIGEPYDESTLAYRPQNKFNGPPGTSQAFYRDPNHVNPPPVPVPEPPVPVPEPPVPVPEPPVPVPEPPVPVPEPPVPVPEPPVPVPEPPTPVPEPPAPVETPPETQSLGGGGEGWQFASMTWYGPGDAVGSYNPVATGYGSCLQNHRGTIPDDVLARYSTLYAGVNDGGSLFGYGKCRDNPWAPAYPICDAQANCGRCYELRCVKPCLRFDGCPSACKGGTVTVLMVDACPADAGFQIELEKQNGFNGCREAARQGSNHFDVSADAMNAIRDGDSGEMGIEFREVPC